MEICPTLTASCAPSIERFRLSPRPLAGAATRSASMMRTRCWRPATCTETLTTSVASSRGPSFALRPRRHLVLQELIHGPFHYPNDGDKSHQLVDLVAALKCERPEQVHLLLGNHELAQWQGEWIAKGDAELSQSFLDGVNTAYGVRSAEIYDAYIRLFAHAALAIRTSNRVFLSHSMPSRRRFQSFDVRILEQEDLEPQHLAMGGAVHSLLWGRDTAQETAVAFLKVVDADLLITGHIPCERGFAAPNDRQLIRRLHGSACRLLLVPCESTPRPTRSF